MTRRTSFIRRVWNFLGLHQLSPSLHSWGFSLVTGPRPWPLIGWWAPVTSWCHEVIPEEGAGWRLSCHSQVTGADLGREVRKVALSSKLKYSLATVIDFLRDRYLWQTQDMNGETWNSKSWMYDPINSPDLSGGCQEDQTSPQYIIVWRICQAWLKTL